MKTHAALLEEKTEIQDELKAIVAVAEKEERELSSEEDTRVEEITASIADLDTKIERRQKIDAEIKAAAASRLTAQIDTQERELQQARGGDSPAFDIQNISVPAKAKSHTELKAFVGDNAEKEAYVAGRFAMAAIYNHQPSLDWCVRNGVINTMSGGISGNKGGFLVPDEMERSLVRLRQQYGVFERYARPYPMSSDNVTVPRLLDDADAYWVGETDETTASDADLGGAEVVAKKLGSLVKVSSELDEDSVVELGDMITDGMALKMAKKADQAGFNGDGSSSYGGITGLKNALNSAAIYDAPTGNTGAKTLDLDDFESVMGMLPEYDMANPVWFVHKTVYAASMARLQLAAGGNTVSNLASGPVREFLGYPVVFTQVMPSTIAGSPSTILAYLGDLRLAATFGRRRGMRVKLSEDRYLEHDLIGVFATQRLGINVHERGETENTRPIIALKTAAS